MSQRQYIFFPGGTAEPISVGDDAVGDRISGGQPKKQFTVQAVPIAEATYQRQIPQASCTNEITWRVDRNHGDAAAAIEFMRDHPELFNNPQPAGILQDVGDDGSIRFLQNCCLVSVHCTSYDGQSTLFEYTARGGAWTDTFN